MEGANAMGERTRRLLAEAMIWGSVLLGVAYAGPQAVPAVAVTAKLDKEVITQHEPVIVTFTLVNPSSKEIRFDLGAGYEKVDIKVTDPDERIRNKPPRFPPKENVSLEFFQAVVASPGKSGVNSIDLNEWFNFDKVGSYRINVAVPSLSNASAAIKFNDTTLTLTVLSRDEAALATTCAALVRRVENWKSAGDSIIAARALSKIDDPAVVPCLAQALKQKLYTSMMISALARLNTPEAIEAIHSASESPDPETRSLARSALRALGKAAEPR